VVFVVVSRFHSFLKHPADGIARPAYTLVWSVFYGKSNVDGNKALESSCSNPVLGGSHSLADDEWQKHYFDPEQPQ
jgi:hypothetical protein